MDAFDSRVTDRFSNLDMRLRFVGGPATSSAGGERRVSSADSESSGDGEKFSKAVRCLWSSANGEVDRRNSAWGVKPLLRPLFKVDVVEIDPDADITELCCVDDALEGDEDCERLEPSREDLDNRHDWWYHFRQLGRGQKCCTMDGFKSSVS